MTNYFKFIKFIAFLFFAFFFQSTAFGQSKIFSATGTGRLPGASANITDLGLPGAVTYQSGTYSWIVPSTGVYEIEVAGAQGGSGGLQAGGLGRLIKVQVSLNAGEVINILSGQQGGSGTDNSQGAGGGGGGTYVKNATTNSWIAVAGGGGGTGRGFWSNSDIIATGSDAAVYNSNNGTTGISSAYSWSPGRNGGINGGQAIYGNGGSAGAGVTFNGVKGQYGGAVGFSYASGSNGGASANSVYAGDGGFGGGSSGYYNSSFERNGGGGGGYSGGGSSGTRVGGGGGGGNYYSGTYVSDNVNSGGGYAKITGGI